MRFEWDPEKARRNLSKHGVSFEDAKELSSIFAGDHSDDEDRFPLLGATHAGHLVVVAHTDRDDSIRIISARMASRSERRTYASG